MGAQIAADFRPFRGAHIAQTHVPQAFLRRDVFRKALGPSSGDHNAQLAIGDNSRRSRLLRAGMFDDIVQRFFHGEEGELWDCRGNNLRFRGVPAKIQTRQADDRARAGNANREMAR